MRNNFIRIQPNWRSLRVLLLLALVAGLFGPTHLMAEDDVQLNIPESSRFVVHVDVKAFRATKIGGKLFEMAKAAALEEIDSADQADFDKIKESIGFDPFTELDAITIVGSDFEHPEESLKVVLQLRETTGNLEGLMLALPEYESSEYGKHEIHSAAPDENEKVFAAIHTGKGGIKNVVAARNMSDVKALLDMLDGKSGMKLVKLSRKNPDFLHVEVLELPLEAIGEGPQANIAKMVQGVSVKLGDADGDVRLSVVLTAKKEKQAKQIRQLIQGLIAMAQLIDDDDADLKKAQALLSDLEVNRKGNEVTLKVAVPEQQIIDLIEDEMDLSLSIF